MPDGFGIYVHWPFCLSRCPYCDFNAHVSAGVDHGVWRDALCRELVHIAGLSRRLKVKSVFFGGGTPSLMEPATTSAVLDTIADLWPLEDDVEVTLEANPTSVEAARLADFYRAGVNRVSLGVQALEDGALRFLGRGHSAEEAIRAVDVAGGIFSRLSVDLIYARPGQGLAAWGRELRRALALGSDHVSLYQLTIEPGTPFASRERAGDFCLPGESRAADFYRLTQAICREAGLPAYEVSNHAAPGAEARHNLIYWRSDDYAGVGPGAHGRLTVDSDRWATRMARLPSDWLAAVRRRGHAVAEAVPLGEEARAQEFLLMGLRLAEGVAVERFGRFIDGRRAAALERDGLLWRRDGRLGVSERGRLVLNSVLAELLSGQGRGGVGERASGPFPHEAITPSRLHLSSA